MMGHFFTHPSRESHGAGRWRAEGGGNKEGETGAGLGGGEGDGRARYWGSQRCERDVTRPGSNCHLP